MADSFSVFPLTAEVRDWLAGEGFDRLPSAEGRQATLAELKAAIAALPDVVAEWSSNQDASLSSRSGLHTTLLVHDVNEDVVEFHFRGGHENLVESVVRSLSKSVGPLVIYRPSDSFTKVVQCLDAP